MSLHEGLDWVYRLNTSYCIFYVREDTLSYVLYRDEACTEETDHYRWISWGETAIGYLEQHSRQKHRLISVLCGPVQPPPSTVILKIRAMEKRRKQYA